MILEAIVTTRNLNGTTNIAPMGPHCNDRQLKAFELRPFCTSTTFTNLKRTGQGVLHVTDDVLLFASAAINSLPDVAIHPAAEIDGHFLVNCCRYYEFETTFVNDASSRASIQCRTLSSQKLRDFFGFNRAMNAVIEASVLATRIDFLPIQEIQSRFREYKTLVEKTGGGKEIEAFQLLQDFVDGTSKTLPASGASKL